VNSSRDPLKNAQTQMLYTNSHLVYHDGSKFFFRVESCFSDFSIVTAALLGLLGGGFDKGGGGFAKGG